MPRNVTLLPLFLLLAISLTRGSTSTIMTSTNNPLTLTFFMHDIVGGSAPSDRVVAGAAATAVPKINGLPFAKRNGGVFPINVGNYNNVNGNKYNLPFLTGATTISTGKSIPYVTAGQLPRAATRQQPTAFGTITVIDDEITRGSELGSSVIGKAQGFHLASSLDGSSRTMAFTAMFGDNREKDEKEEDEEEEDDSISFFGVHRTAERESHLAVVGGTGRYREAKGYVKIETGRDLENELATDGVETLLRLSVFL